MTLSKMTLSIMTLSKMTLSKMTLNKMTLNKMTHETQILNVISSSINMPNAIILCAVVLNVVAPWLIFAFLDADED